LLKISAFHLFYNLIFQQLPKLKTGGVKRRIRNGQKQNGKSSLKKRPKEFNTFWKTASPFEKQTKGHYILQHNC